MKENIRRKKGGMKPVKGKKYIWLSWSVDPAAASVICSPQRGNMPSFWTRNRDILLGDLWVKDGKQIGGAVEGLSLP